MAEFESKSININTCPNIILSPDHYTDKSCRCFDKDASEMKGYGYKWNSVKGYWDSARAMNRAKPKTKQKKCVSCEEKFNVEDMRVSFDNEDICESCESDDHCEPIASVHHLMENPEFSQRIGQYFNETDGDFTVEYVSTDGWRGHYLVKSDSYVQVHEDCALAYSDDEQNLKQFDDFLIQLAKKYGIGLVRVTTRTSNLFSCGVDYFVHKSHLNKYNKFVDKIKSVQSNLRDPHEFNRTAITGE